MKLLRILKNKRCYPLDVSGFTLVEVIVVLGIALCVFAMTPIFDLKTIISGSVREEASLFLMTVYRARHNALVGKGHTSWGIHVDKAAYVLFTGDEYDEKNSSNEYVERNSEVIVHIDTDIVFKSVAGTTEERVIVFSKGSEYQTAVLHSQGIIQWIDI